MAKKNTGDKSLVISKAIFDKFNKIDDKNIKDFFNETTMFIIIVNAKNKINMLHSFMVTRKLTKGVFKFNYMWDGNLSSCNVIVRENESAENYEIRINDLKSYMKNEIKFGRLYARSIQ